MATQLTEARLAYIASLVAQGMTFERASDKVDAFIFDRRDSGMSDGAIAARIHAYAL